MEKIMNDYLEKIEKYLKPMSVSERVDIIKEIKSEVIELQSNGMTSTQIIERLGDPKELAKAYLGDSISKSSAFSWHKFVSVIAFYSLAGLRGMIVLPIVSVSAIAFMICGVMTVAGGIIKFVGYLFGYDFAGISFEFGSYSANAIAFLPISIVMGVLLFILGKYFWKLTIKFVKTNTD